MECLLSCAPAKLVFSTLSCDKSITNRRAAGAGQAKDAQPKSSQSEIDGGEVRPWLSVQEVKSISEIPCELPRKGQEDTRCSNS